MAGNDNILNPTRGNNFMDWLEQPGFGMQAAFQSFAGDQPNLPASRRSHFRSQFQPTMNEFLGQLGGQARMGQAPTASWVDFLKGKGGGDDPFTRMAARAPSERGMGRVSTFAPRSRFLYNF